MCLQKCALSKKTASVFLAILIVLILAFKCHGAEDEAIVLRVILNTVVVGDFILLERGDDILIKRQDLESTDLRPGLGSDVIVSGEKYVPLKSLKGLSFKIDWNKLVLDITASPELFKPQRADVSNKRPYAVTYTRDNAAFFNYGVFYDSTDDSKTFDGEAGLRYRDYSFISTFQAMNDDETSTFARLLSTIRRDDIANMRTYLLGDFPVSSDVLGSSVLMGGLSMSKNYSVDPYFLRYPSVNLKGQLYAPTQAQVYVNGQLVSTQTLAPGAFALNNLPATVGLGAATVVLRDIYGNTETISQPFFYSNELLEKGLHEYSYNIGYLRQNYGTDSFSYATPVVSVFHNYGFTNSFKGGGFFEASPDTINMGPDITFALPGHIGVMETALSVSSAQGKNGGGAFAGYVFQSRALTLSASLRALTPEAGSLQTASTADKALLEASASAGYGTRLLGSFSVGYTLSRMRFSGDTTVYTVSYQRTLIKDLFFNCFYTRTLTTGQQTADQITAGLTIYLGRGLTASTGLTAGSGQPPTSQVSIQKSLPAGPGYGFDVTASQAASSTSSTGIFNYQNDYGTYQAGWTQNPTGTTYQLSGAGGVGYIDSSLFLSRPITDSFAEVKAGVPDVRVYYYGNEVGRTDSRGDLMVPQILSFNDNKLEIEKNDIPLEYSIPELSQYINPPFRSGSLVDFKLKKVQAFGGTVILVEKGVKLTPIPGGLTVFARGAELASPVGTDGEFYLENAPPGIWKAEITEGEKECSFDIIVPESKDIFVDLGEQTCHVIKK